MVVFTCNTCGDSLKKNQVEKHYTTVCRRCEVLSCVDCGKDFWGDEYQKHTKCITEEEKYSGKNYQPKPNANKGEVKQMQWTQQVQDAIDKSKSHPKLRNLLERMKEYPNIPRKKAKFENFVKNSLNTRDNNLVTQVWDLLLANASQNSQSTSKDTTSDKTSDNNENSSKNETENSEHINGNICDANNSTEENEKKLSKRERKEERQKKLHKKEKKDKFSNEDISKDNVDNSVDDINKNKKKKRRRQEEENVEEECSSKKKRVTDIEDSSDSLNQSNTDEIDHNDDSPHGNVKFNWEEVITNVLNSKGEISLKRLRKKVVAEYISQGCRVKTEEKLWAKFNKKVNKNPTFLVLKDRVKLRQR